MSFINKLFELDNSEIIYGLTDELKCIYISQRYKKLDKSILIVLNTLYEANKLYQSLSNYIDDVYLFPMDDFLTSEALAMSPELKTTRLETLENIIKNKKNIVITNLMGYLRYLPPKESYKQSFITCKTNDEIDVQKLIKKLDMNGYIRQSIVTKTGEMAIRGFVIDIFPINEKNPIRIELFGDEIDSIRIFDVDTQRTIKEIDSIIIAPNSEFIINQSVEYSERKQKNLINYIKPVNIGKYLDDSETIFINYSNIKIGYEQLQNQIFDYNTTEEKTNTEKYMHNLDDIKNDTIIYLESFDNKIDNVKNIKIYKTHDILPFSKEKKEINMRLNRYISNKNIVIICLGNEKRINNIIDYLENNNIVITNENEIFENKINVIKKVMTKGFEFNNYIIITENELFNKKELNIKYKSNFKYGTKIKNINNLNINDYVVHVAHGIGRYTGLKTLTKNGLKKDYLTIEYKGGDKLYIPVEKIELISKFSSNEGVVPKINKLGSTEWQKTKLKIQKKLENIAGQLLELYAKRESSIGFAFDKDDENQIAFEKEFKFTETIDQLKVIEEIKKDMEKPKPMDRLLCGDVGYGKTEVAFRAMFKAVLSSKQVAYLCPTTILSNQHYENALLRFQNFPVRIELLNRFVTPARVKKIKQDLIDGKIDIVIGTHRLLSEDIVFKDLGLLVIDEEQRFGVKHKEKIKKLKSNVDILTLSATPIPRTLQMSLTGIRNLSLIETPPVDRYPIQTYVLEENKGIIKDAIYKELSRGGQIFILFNNIEEMDLKMLEINKLIPDAKIVCAHGRMNKSEIEEVMLKFINKEYDILLCTTIIETGIDIPNVNTLIIIDADHFGLSQLYQIRGRVGRSNKIAYCYLMYNKGKILSEIATKRLNVIKEFTELGSGFKIAMRDLSIRGAGDILGSEQAGFIDSIGIDLYLRMLDEEINKIKGIKPKEDVTTDKPLLEVETSIDDKYVNEVDLKIEIHEKINSIDSYDKLIKVKEELEDRFGKITESILIYMYEEWFEKEANKLNIIKVRQTSNFVEITLPKEITNILRGDLLFTEVSAISRMFRFSMKHECLIITLDIVKLDRHFIYYLIELLEVIKKAISS